MNCRGFYLSLCLFARLLTACGGSVQGGSEFGNPTRTLLGALTKAIDCPADALQAIDSLGQMTTGEINEEDCSFAVELTAGKSYQASFTLGDEVVLTLIVRNSATAAESSVFFFAEDDVPMDLGDITIEDDEAIPENEPATQNDEDNDGTSDFDDVDDDGDGVADDFEEDCDADGFLDDSDEGDQACDPNEGE